MENKVALVIGASSEIGKAITEGLVACGYNVVMTYKDHFESIVKSEKSLLMRCDITKEQDIIDLVNSTVEHFGHIDLIVNNAGISLDNLIEEKTKEEFMKVLDTNLVGPFLVVKHASKYLEGSIVIQIASTDGIDTYNEYNIDYSVSKAGLIHLTKTLAYALPKTKFYCVAPNYVNTESIRNMNPNFLKEELKRVGQRQFIEPSEVAKEVVALTKGDKKSGSLILIRGDKK